jgi:hypothetical protein
MGFGLVALAGRPKNGGCMKKKLLLAVGIMVGMAGSLFAASAVTVTFTPTGTRGVYIDAPLTQDLGSFAVGTSSTTNAFVTHSTGTISHIAYSVQGAYNSGGGAFTAHNVANVTPANTEAMVKAVFHDTASNPVFDASSSSDTVDATLRPVGNYNSMAGFNQFVSGNCQSGGSTYVDDQALNNTTYLFINVTLPPVANYNGQQSVTITVSARLNN